jgi:hypothetical protein
MRTRNLIKIQNILQVKSLYCGMWRGIVQEKFADVSEERNASIFKIED